MGSKKQRSKALKAKATARVTNTVTAAAKVGTKTIPSAKEDSLFLRLPREVRDKIYDELLIARLTPEDQEKYDKVRAATKTPCGSFGRENALDYLERDICIMPGGNKSYPFIMDAMGLLLANKQIHDEANTTLFSKNVFLILVEWERVYPFWRCESPKCYPPDSPCFIMFHLFKQINHVYILVQNTRSMDDPCMQAESIFLNRNLQTVARCFREGGNKLKSLTIRYTTCFDGQIDTVRDTLEGELEEGIPERTAMLKDRYGQYHCVSRADAADKLFKFHDILDPLRNLKGIAELVQIRGDLPGPYIDELKSILSVPLSKLGAKAKKQRETDQAERKQREEADKSSGFHGFMRSMVEKYKGTPEEETYRDMMKASAKSPAVLADLCAPPTKEELERCRAIPTTMSGEVASDESSDESSDGGGATNDDPVSGGIGFINGKPSVL